MMGRTKTIYTCQSCGHATGKWHGRCPECGQWNTVVEEKAMRNPRGGLKVLAPMEDPLEVSCVEASATRRTCTGISEFDRVLGGGLVPGGTVLIGGDPGIGKSTLLLQAMAGLAGVAPPVLYVSGEESMAQIRLRAERLGAMPEGLQVWSETSVERVLEVASEKKPSVMVVDSVQTLFTDGLESAPGSVAQVRETSSRLIAFAKTSSIPVFLVGHVTKDGAIAGPRVLEHMVDTVLYFESNASSHYRILRAVKNRFGSAMEIGVFEMTGQGLSEVKDPSDVFLGDRDAQKSGSCVLPSIEGTRTLLVEVQALVTPALFGVPRRTIVGVDSSKVSLLVAVMEKRAGLLTANHDIFVKLAGGLRVDEPAVDLAVVASLASNLLDKPVAPGTVVFGEVGLSGEVRAVTRADIRVKEARKLGFTRCVLPKDNISKDKITRDNLNSPGIPGGMEVVGVSTVKEAIEAIFG